MKTLEGEIITVEDIAHNLNVSVEHAEILIAAPMLWRAIGEMPTSPRSLAEAKTIIYFAKSRAVAAVKGV